MINVQSIIDDFVASSQDYDSFYEYLDNEVLEIVAKTSYSRSEKNVTSIKLVLTVGGPHIEIDLYGESLDIYENNKSKHFAIDGADWEIVFDACNDLMIAMN